ncbi:Aste57867_24166 [Aphanomyces stellatus]|uniref:Aste57867_24166 protein n=1 Tax=Aphanomyces stellatus TaxID=120398 RepID=A0A485LPQ7_9STRA|nr:hypothetical protein As57867_024092 [Aphanomyces stellatus]VFU00808.1 Aste57867_24166 [Aphanomyces stellatus]
MRPSKKSSFERHKSIKDVRVAMTRQPSIIDAMLSSTLSKSSLHDSKGRLTDTMRQSVRTTMAAQLIKTLSRKSVGSTISSAAKTVHAAHSIAKKYSIEEEPSSLAAALPKLAVHEEHVEELRQAVIRLVADGEVKVEKSPGEHVSYDRQGDLKYYTDENLKQRLSMRVHPLLSRISRLFWRMIVCESGPDAEHDDGLSMEFDGYQNLMVRIHKVLIELFDLDESKLLIKEDWVRDTNASHVLPYELFHLSLFELIDIWCDSLDPDDYCNLLFLIFNGIARMQGSEFVLMRLQDVQYTDVVEELHMRPLTACQIELRLDEIDQALAAQAAAEAAAKAAKAARDAAPPPDPPIEASSEALPPPDTTNGSDNAEEFALNIPSGLMGNDRTVADIRPTKLHKVKMVTHAPSAEPTYRPDAVASVKPDLSHRPDGDLNSFHAPPKHKTSTLAQAPAPPPHDAVDTAKPPPVEPPSPRHASNSGRPLNQVVPATDMDNVLAHANASAHMSLTPHHNPQFDGQIRHASLARAPPPRKSNARNPNLKEPNKSFYKQYPTPRTSSVDGFSIISYGMAAQPGNDLTSIEPTPVPTPEPVAPLASVVGAGASNDGRTSFSLAGAKSPRGHPLWKPKRPMNNDTNNRFGLGVSPGNVSGGDIFAVKGLGGRGDGQVLTGGHPFNYAAASPTPTMDMGPLSGFGIGIQFGKPHYKPPKDVPNRPITGIVMAKRDSFNGIGVSGMGGHATAVPSLSQQFKQGELRPAAQFNNDRNMGGRNGRRLSKKAGAYASEMVQDLAALSFGTSRQAPTRGANGGRPPLAGPPMSPTVRDVGEMRLGSPSAYAKIYRGGQRMVSHLTSQHVDRDSNFDGQLVAQRMAADPPESPRRPQTYGNRSNSPRKPAAMDRNMASLKLNAQAIGSTNTDPASRPRGPVGGTVVRKPLASKAPTQELGQGIDVLARALQRPAGG